MLHPLTENQKVVLNHLCDFIKLNNYPPTIKEIQKELGIGNPGTVYKFFLGLERKGYIVREKGRHRGVDLTSEAKGKYLQ